jgi:hypothetical protein
MICSALLFKKEIMERDVHKLKALQLYHECFAALNKYDLSEENKTEIAVSTARYSIYNILDIVEYCEKFNKEFRYDSEYWELVLNELNKIQ